MLINILSNAHVSIIKLVIKLLIFLVDFTCVKFISLGEITFVSLFLCFFVVSNGFVL